MRKIFTLLILAILATASSWAATKTGTITFSTTGVKISSASVTGDDDLGNTWTITTVGTTSFTPNESYYQVGSSKKPATSITFTATLPSEVKITSMSAKFGGFSGTAGSIKLSVGDTEVGSGSLNAGTDVTVTSSTQATGTDLTVSITGIAKGVKCYNISYTYEDAASDTRTATTLSFGADLDGKTITKYVGEPDFEFTHEATLSPAVDGATITYTSSNVDVAMVEDGYVMGDTKTEGIATIKAAYAGNDTYKPSEASYNIEVKKLPLNFSIADNTEVQAGATLTISTIEGGTLKYTIDDEPEVTVNTNTVDITLNKSCAIIATALYNGAKNEDIRSYNVAKKPTSIAIGGTLATTEYWVGDDFKTDGLTVTATYDDATTEDVTAKSTLAAAPATLSEAGEQEVTVKATYGTLTATATYTVTVKAIPEFTYTWYVDGKVSKTSTLKRGAEVVAPADPANIGDKTFTGWVTTATVDAATAPTYATIDKTATANTTYYAVFASHDDKWVKKSASKITEEGVYALITAEGKAFNGTITSGHGQSTAATFAFDNNGEATAAPEGTCELTFVKNDAGYKMLNKATNKYLYAKDKKSGSLEWQDTENSYWSYTSSNWVYNAKKAYLRVYQGTFRTYGSNTNYDLYFAQKSSTYSDYVTIVPAALASVVANGEVGRTYTVNDGVVVAKFEASDKHYLVVKDDAEAVRNSSAPADGDKFFNIAGQKQQDYAQNNWMLVSVPVETYNQVDVNKVITEATGTLTDALNTTLEATSVTVGDNAAEAYTPNTYCPANFMGKSSVTAKDGSNYYFATPKANEYAKVVWAVYNATDGAFYLPAHSGSVNTQEFKGAFTVDYSMNSAGEPALVDGSMYEFEGVIKEVAASEAQSAPRKVEANTTTEPSSKFVVYPVNFNGDKVVTGVSEVTGAKTVKSVSYFNMMGEQSAEPFSGVNIVVTTYTDGTTHAQKAIR